MRLNCRILSIVTILLSGSVHAADTPLTPVSTVGDLASLLEGEFTTATAPIDAPADKARTQQTPSFSILAKRVQVPSLGRDVVYSELHAGGPDGRLLSQKLYTLKLDDEQSRIIMTSYNAGNAQEFSGAYRDPMPLAKLNASDLKVDANGCAVIWHKTEGGFDGDADPATCKTTTAEKDKAVISVSKTGMTELVPDSPSPTPFRRLR